MARGQSLNRVCLTGENLCCPASPTPLPSSLLWSPLKSSMAEVKNGDETLLSSKRSPDRSTEDHLNGPKKQKVEDSNNGGAAPEAIKVSREDELVQKSKDREPKAEEEEREEKEDDQEGEDHSNGEAVIDRKGKGILIEEDDEEDEDHEDDSDSDLDSDSDSDIGDNLSDDSDFADDPLVEVDLDNILPSRTRRKSIRPGAYIANDLPDEDSDESDDPDA